jgi:hypothetical protein
MTRILFVLALLAAGAVAAAEESDRNNFTGAVDLSWVQANSELPSWLQNGNGKLRFDDDHDGLRFSRAFLDYRGRILPTLNAKVTLNINDDISPSLGVTEAYLEWRPLPRSAWRFRGRAGAFYPKLSMENTDAGWSTPYGLSASVINTWIGEELRAFGGEMRLTRDFLRWPEQHLSFEGGMFYGNDPTGALLAWRGWTAHDRQTGINGKVPLPSQPALEPWDDEGDPPAHFSPFKEIDHHAGFYAGAEWQWDKHLRIKYVHYDNHANPEAETSDGLYAWQTWFDHVGAEVELPWDIGLIGQWIKGSTRSGDDLGPWHVEDLDFKASFLTLTRAFGKNRLSARYEWFDSQPFDDPDGYTNKDDGNAFAVSYLYQFTKQFRVGAEYLQIATEHCDVGAFCAWVAGGLPRTTREDTLRVTVRWRFDASL